VIGSGAGAVLTAGWAACCWRQQLRGGVGEWHPRCRVCAARALPDGDGHPLPFWLKRWLGRLVFMHAVTYSGVVSVLILAAMQMDAVSVSCGADGGTRNESNMVAELVPVPPTVSSDDATSSHDADAGIVDAMGCKKMLEEILLRITGVESILHRWDGAREEKRRWMVGHEGRHCQKTA
jgi:hypothetical protein